ncbi:MAG: FAD-binding oxidoreductase [Pseudomonadales bacterium]|nr:FAD-binding oxidoreductase [Pseudomonadales bacterium]
MAEWIEGTVSENIHWTENLFTLKIDADIADYKAGQFTSLALEIDGERVARPYSHLSSPGQHPLEYFFYTATDGILSNALVKLEAGDKVWVKKQSNGFFVLEEIPPARDLWMLGTGTGVAPFFSILNTDEPWQRFETIALIYAVRTEADLRYLELIDAIGNRYGDRFRFQAFVSREDVPNTLPGRIPASIDNGALEAAVNLEMSPEHSHFMLCGNPDMVKDVTELLKTRGFNKNRRRTPGHITTENYW